MKKSLLTLAVVLSATASFAQDGSEKTISQNRRVQKSEVATVRHEKTMNQVAVQKSARRSVENNVYYARPAGTYWQTGSTANGTFEYLLVPPFTSLTFENLCANKTEAKWTINNQDASTLADADNNFVMSYDKPAYGYVSYPPAITVGSETYSVSDFILPTDSVPMVMHPFNYLRGKRYSGYSGGASPFMSGADSFDFDEDGEAETFFPYGFRQFFEKPATALRLHEVTLWFTTTNKDFDGHELKAVFSTVKRNDEGRRVIGDTIAVMDCAQAIVDPEAQDGLYMGDITFALEEEDEFGTPTSIPVLLDQAFAITITGTDTDGLDVRFFFTDQGEDAAAFATYASPTYIVPVDANGKPLGTNPNGLSYYNSTDDGDYCYSLLFFFYGEMEGIEVATGSSLNVQRAEVTGGETGADSEQEKAKGAPAYVYTNYPFFNAVGEEFEPAGNYGFDGIPDWAQIHIDPTYYEYGRGTENEMRGLNMIWFEVAALPDGETGRMAKVYVESAFGYKYPVPIFILQGDAEVPAGVKAIQFDAQGKYVNSYNMSGQRVSDNQKGLVIRGGKKMIVK